MIGQSGQGYRFSALTLGRSEIDGGYGAATSPFKAVFEEWAFVSAPGRLKVWNGVAWV